MKRTKLISILLAAVLMLGGLMTVTANDTIDNGSCCTAMEGSVHHCVDVDDGFAFEQLGGWPVPPPDCTCIHDTCPITGRPIYVWCGCINR